MSTTKADEMVPQATPGFSRVDDLPEVRSRLVGRDTVFRLVKTGKIPCVRLSTRRLLVPLDWAERLMRAQAAAE